MEQHEVIDVIVAAIDAAIDRVLEGAGAGYPAGHNGPYNQEETAVRAVSGWISTFRYAYRLKASRHFGSREMLAAAGVFAEYLKEDSIRANGTFICRNAPPRDSGNGLIGQAWALNGLVNAGILLNDRECFDLAERCFLQHRFMERAGLWRHHDIGGTELPLTAAFNQHCWFAAAGAGLASVCPETESANRINMQVERFLDECRKETIFLISPEGRISHEFPRGIRKKASWRLRGYAREYLERFGYPSMKYKEQGYHLFALFGLAILKNHDPDHPLWGDAKLKKAVAYGVSDQLLNDLQRNRWKSERTGIAAKHPESPCNVWGFPYNSPAFELPYIFRTFLGREIPCERLSELWQDQIRLTCDRSAQSFSDTIDAATLSSRFYELLMGLTEADA